MSKDGLTWTVPLALDGARFASGRPVTAADVADRSTSPGRPPASLGDLCATAINQLDAAETAQDGTAVTPGSRRSSPLLAEVLARLPVLDMTAVDSAAAAIATAAGDLDPAAPDALVKRVLDALDADDCLTEQPRTAAGSPTTRRSWRRC
ncbi:MAG: hypothetical protein R3C32_15745 [Chloroflexota bacterium]